MGDPRTITAAAGQFALACCAVSLYYLFTLGEYAPEWFFPLVLLPYSLLVYGINCLFLRRERTLRALYILNAALALVLLVAYLCLESRKGTTYLISSAALIAWLTIRGGQMAYSGPDLRSTLLTLDGSFLCLLLLTAYCSFTATPLHWVWPAAAGFAAAIIALAGARNNQRLGLRSWLVMGGAFGVLLLGLGLLLSVAATPAGGGLVALWNMVCALGSRLGTALIRAIHWLLSLLPDAEGTGDLLPRDPMAAISEEVPVEETAPVMGVLALVVLGAALLAAAVWIVRYLGRIKLGGTGIKKTAPAPKRERISLLAGLTALLLGWARAMRLRLYLHRNRNTPTGLYFLLVHRYRKAPWHKRAGETPREFLLRLARSAGEDKALSAALTGLAGAVDAAFYSAAPADYPANQARLVRRRSGAAARRQFFRDSLARLKRRRSITP